MIDARRVYAFWIVYAYVLCAGMLAAFIGFAIFGALTRNWVLVVAGVYFALNLIRFFNRVVRRVVFRRIRRAIRILDQESTNSRLGA